MERMFVFVFETRPVRGSQFFGQVDKALADVWVWSDDESLAETTAREYVMNLGFVISSSEAVRVIDPAQLFRYRKDAQATFHQAKEHGIACTFAWQPPADREGSSFEIFRMEPLPHSSDNSH